MKHAFVGFRALFTVHLDGAEIAYGTYDAMLAKFEAMAPTRRVELVYIIKTRRITIASGRFNKGLDVY